MADSRAPEYKDADRRMAQRPSDPAQESVLPTPQARQAVTGHNVRYVLGFGLAGIVVAFIVIYLIFFG